MYCQNKSSWMVQSNGMRGGQNRGSTHKNRLHVHQKLGRNCKTIYCIINNFQRDYSKLFVLPGHGARLLLIAQIGCRMPSMGCYGCLAVPGFELFFELPMIKMSLRSDCGPQIITELCILAGRKPSPCIDKEEYWSSDGWGCFCRAWHCLLFESSTDPSVLFADFADCCFESILF